MKEKIKQVFLENGIEYFAPRDYSTLTVINSRLEGRIGFDIKSAFIFLVPYYVSPGENVSAYATSLDYHLVIRELGARLVSGLSSLFPGESFYTSADHSPIDERAAALTSGLGILGQNGLIINESYGSYVFIGEILTSIEPCRVFAVEPAEISHCSGCGSCRRACPTGILRGEGEGCLSAITQKRGALSECEVDLMKKYGTVWGCDLCQSSCPHNASPKVTPIELFHTERLTRVKKSDIDAMTDEEFSRRAFAWRGRGVMLRNLELVYGEK